MARPDFAFATRTHTFRAGAEQGTYLAEPGGAVLRLDIAAQQVPPELLSPDMERVVAAWLMARGAREMHLNGVTRPLWPAMLDRLPANPVRRVVSIAPSNAEIMAALDAAHLLVGVESSTDYPPETAGLPKLGPDLHVDMEALAALRPDLVLASLTVPGMERNLAALDALGLPMLVLAPRTMGDIGEDVRRVGSALGMPERAEAVAGGMRAQLAGLADDATQGQRTMREDDAAPVRVLLQWWHQPIFTPGAHCWTNEMLAAAGGVNVFAHLPCQSTEVSPEDVAAADPEVILLSWCGVPMEKLNPHRVMRNEALRDVRAVREGRVFALDEALVGRPGPRVAQGAAEMARLLRLPGHMA